MDCQTLPALKPHSSPLAAYIVAPNSQYMIFTYLHVLFNPHFPLFLHIVLQFLKDMHEFVLVSVNFVEHEDKN